jgi:DNA-binding MarR family transcriptional regulator
MVVDAATKEQALRAYFAAMAVADPLRAQFWNSRGLTMPQVRLLFLLLERDGLTMSTVADRFGVTQPTMTRLVDRVVQHGLVVRADDPRDRRIVRLFITRDGERAAQATESAAHAFMARIFERMGEARTAAFIEALREFRHAAEDVDPTGEFRA